MSFHTKEKLSFYVVIIVEIIACLDGPKKRRPPVPEFRPSYEGVSCPTRARKRNQGERCMFMPPTLDCRTQRMSASTQTSIGSETPMESFLWASWNL